MIPDLAEINRFDAGWYYTPVTVYPDYIHTGYYLAEKNDYKDVYDNDNFFPAELNTILSVKPKQINYRFLVNNQSSVVKAGFFYYKEEDRI